MIQNAEPFLEIDQCSEPLMPYCVFRAGVVVNASVVRDVVNRFAFKCDML